MVRTQAPVTPPVVCTIAGSDSGGGAGIQADLKTIEAGGAFGTNVVTSITAQNTFGVSSTHVLPTEEVAAQVDAVFDDFDVATIKTGMLATESIVELTTERVGSTDIPSIIDPVMVAASGDRLLEPEAETAYENLVAEATLVTPNIDEAQVLTGVAIEDTSSAETAATDLLEMGADAALVTGGHRPGDQIIDVLATPNFVETLTHPRVDTDASHGSGCMLASAIATRLAFGDDLDQAVQSSVDQVGRAVRYNMDVGQGPGAVNHLVTIRDKAERCPTADMIANLVSRFECRDVAPIVPEVGMNIVGATPYAETPAECVAVDGRITRTVDGARANRGVRVGASSHVARFLLAMREFDSSYRFAVDCRFDADIEAALPALDGPISEYDRAEEPVPVKESEGSTMAWGARSAWEAVEGAPIAVIDRGEVGKEAIVKLLADDAYTLSSRVFTVLDALE